MRFAANIPGASTHMLTLFESSLLRFRFFLKSRLYVISIIIIKAKADIHPSIYPGICAQRLFKNPFYLLISIIKSNVNPVSLFRRATLP